MSFTDVLLLMFGAVLVENFIFSKFYGCCSNSHARLLPQNSMKQ